MVRADPPPVELPRELWRRLAEAGEIRERDLPAGWTLRRWTGPRRPTRTARPSPVLDVVAGPAGRTWCCSAIPALESRHLARYLMLTLAETAGPGPPLPHGGDRTIRS